MSRKYIWMLQYASATRRLPGDPGFNLQVIKPAALYYYWVLTGECSTCKYASRYCVADSMMWFTSSHSHTKINSAATVCQVTATSMIKS